MKNVNKKIPSSKNSGPKNLAEEILDTLWEPLLVLEEDLSVRSANDAFYSHFQVEPAETVGRQVYELGNGQWDIPLLRLLLEEVLPKKTSLKNFEIEHFFEQIGQRTLLLNARRIDHLQLILLAMEDITEHKKNVELQAAKAASEEACRARSEFLANMSHEIRTPMTVFLLAIELLLQKEQTPECRKLVEMADQSAQQLRSLLDDILDFSRIEARGVTVAKEPFDLHACVQSTLQRIGGKARVKNLHLQIDMSPAIPARILGDSGRLGQILLNLMDNAIKFTRQGEVRLSVVVMENNLEFTVSDTGIGVPDEKKEMIFQRFSQADSSFTRKHGGAGLGLSIVKGLVELMGGQIGVRDLPGGGSVFFFTLPLHAATNAGIPFASPVASTRILLVEDEPMVRDMIKLVLNQHGWQLETAGNGREAVKKWQTGNFDLILMDLQMPEMNGLEATRQIRKAEEDRRIHIIGLTGHTRAEAKAECLAAGMDEVLIKPVRIGALLSAIQSCFAASLA